MIPQQLYLQGTPLDKVSKYKYLGVTFTTDLNWSEHIHSISMKSKKLLGHGIGSFISIPQIRLY